MGLWDKLSNARNFVRNRRGPDSYFQYKRKREDERNDAEQARERASDRVEGEQGKAEREHEYEERFSADRESDVAAKQRTEEVESDP